MISTKKLPRPSEISTNNVSTALSSNMLGYLLEYVKLSSLPNLGKLNKKFKGVIQDKKKLPLFHDFLEIRRHKCYITDVRKELNPYINLLKNKLNFKKKYTSTQIDNVVTEIVYSLFKQICFDGKLDLSSNYLGKSSCEILSNFLKVYNNLTTLILSDNKIGENVDVMKDLSDALKVNKTLTTLELYNNLIGGGNPENMKNLSDVLKVNKTLTKLNLSWNNIGYNPEGIKNLSDALKDNHTLTTLELSFNCIGGGNPEIMKNLSDAIKVNKKLTTLDLSLNFIGYKREELKNLSDALKENNTLTKLNLSENFIGKYSEDIKNLSDALKVNKTLTTIYQTII